ncbi:hypothetical protein Tco_0303087 [Tanacetum coccineum]
MRPNFGVLQIGIRAKKITPKKRTTRASPAITTTTTTTTVTNAQLKALIDQGVADAFAACDADRSMNDDDSHNSGTSVRRQAPLPRETVVYNIAYIMAWTDLKKKMTDKYYLRSEIKKLEVEMWNLKVKGTDVISTLPERQAENKRKLDNNNQAQQQPPKKKGVAIAYAIGSGERKESLATTNNQRDLTCYEGGNQGHYRSDCMERKNQNHENQTGGEVRFGKWGKLNPRYVGPSKVMEKGRFVAYKLELPQKLSRVHHTFHVSNLKKCYTDEPLTVLLDGFHIDDKLHFIEEPTEIMNREVKRLKQSCIPIVKVR